MSVVSWWVVLPVGLGLRVHLVYECCKIKGDTPCGLGVGCGGHGVPLVYECCKLVDGTSCGLGIGGGGSL